MSSADFTPRTWANGERVPASAMNRLEAGILSAHEKIDGGRITEAVTALVQQQFAHGPIPVTPHVEGDQLYFTRADGVELLAGHVRGIPGKVGDTGPANTLTVDRVVQVGPDEQPRVDISGVAPNQHVVFYMPQGQRGEQGIPGNKGDKGDIGPAGLTWRGPWSADVDYVEDEAVAYNGSTWFATGDPFKGEIPSASSTGWQLMTQQGSKGDKGDRGDAGPYTDIAGGVVTTLAAGSAATASLAGPAGSKTLNLGIPQGIQGVPGDQTAAQGTVAAPSTFTVNLSQGPQTIPRVLTGDVAVNFQGAGLPGQAYTMTVIAIQDAVGGRKITWPSGIKWPEGIAPQPAQGPNAVTLFHILWSGSVGTPGNFVLGFLGGQNFA